MLIFCEFKFSLYRFGGCRQFRVSNYLLWHPADSRALCIKPAGHLISEIDKICVET